MLSCGSPSTVTASMEPHRRHRATFSATSDGALMGGMIHLGLGLMHLGSGVMHLVFSGNGGASAVSAFDAFLARGLDLHLLDWIYIYPAQHNAWSALEDICGHYICQFM